MTDNNINKKHKYLWTIVKCLDSDFEPYGSRNRDEDYGPDCSCGCYCFEPVRGPLGSDWGVCTNNKSPRCGLLTFEHMGCKEYYDGFSEDCVVVDFEQSLLESAKQALEIAKNKNKELDEGIE